MTNRKRTYAMSALAGTMISMIALTGCGETEEPAEETRAAPPPPPPPRDTTPSVASIDSLMEQLGIDRRVAMAEDKAPQREQDRRAVLEFFDAFVRGNDSAVSRVISPLDRFELERLVDSGQWEDTVEDIGRVELQFGRGPEGADFVLAVFYVDMDFQPQLWRYERQQGEAMFTSVATPPGIMDELYGDNWIVRWHEVLQEEMQLAMEPDEEVVIPQQDVGDNSSRSQPGTRPNPGGPQRGPGTVPPPSTPPPPPGAPDPTGN